MHLPSCQESVDLRTPKKKKVLPFNLSNTSNIPNIIRSPCSPMSPSSCNIMEGEIKNRAPECNNVRSAGDSFCSQKSTLIRRMESNLSHRERLLLDQGSQTLLTWKRCKRCLKRQLKRTSRVLKLMLLSWKKGWLSYSTKSSYLFALWHFWQDMQHPVQGSNRCNFLFHLFDKSKIYLD